MTRVAEAPLKAILEVLFGASNGFEYAQEGYTGEMEPVRFGDPRRRPWQLWLRADKDSGMVADACRKP